MDVSLNTFGPGVVLKIGCFQLTVPAAGESRKFVPPTREVAAVVWVAVLGATFKPTGGSAENAASVRLAGGWLVAGCWLTAG